MIKDNFFSNIPPELKNELFEEIVAGNTFRMERIVSRGHASPPDFWYDQDENEWVLVLQGSAGLRFEGEEDPVILQPGDYIFIPRHLKHRVEWTDSVRETIWLAVYYK